MEEIPNIWEMIEDNNFLKSVKILNFYLINKEIWKRNYFIKNFIKFIIWRNSKNTPIYLQTLFASLMGLRKSEINGIKYSDIDYVHRRLYLERQLR